MASRHDDGPHTCYMRRGVFDFLRAWPHVTADYEATWNELYEARMIATPLDDVVNWKYGPSLTNGGYVLKQLVDSQNLNMFGVDSILSIWPIELLRTRRDDCTAYLGLFTSNDSMAPLDWNHRSVRRYIAAGVDRPYATSLTIKVEAVEKVRLGLMQAGLSGLFADSKMTRGLLTQALGSYFRGE